MITYDLTDWRRLGREVREFGDKAVAIASRHTLNRAAFDAQDGAREGLKQGFTLRNAWTRRSIQVNKASTLDLDAMTAEIGSTEDYMRVQEFGGTKARTGSEGVTIPTGYSAGSEGERPRTRLPRRPNRMRNIQLNRLRNRGVSRKQRNAIAVREAAKSGRKFIFMDLGRRKGIFKVTGGKRAPRVKMVHDLTRQSVFIPPNPWLAPTVEQTTAKIPGFWSDALEFQARRLGLFQDN